jgi:hypothetical protein
VMNYVQSISIVLHHSVQRVQREVPLLKAASTDEIRRLQTQT